MINLQALSIPLSITRVSRISLRLCGSVPLLIILCLARGLLVLLRWWWAISGGRGLISLGRLLARVNLWRWRARVGLWIWDGPLILIIPRAVLH
jgi:hypothetical protein